MVIVVLVRNNCRVRKIINFSNDVKYEVINLWDKLRTDKLVILRVRSLHNHEVYAVFSVEDIVIKCMNLHALLITDFRECTPSFEETIKSVVKELSKDLKVSIVCGDERCPY